VSVSLSVCLPLRLSAAACPHYCTDPDVAWDNGRICPLVVHCWTDLQSVHGFRCYDNIRERELSANACPRSMPGVHFVMGECNFSDDDDVTFLNRHL